MTALLDATNLSRSFDIAAKRLFAPPRKLHAVSDVNLTLARGEVLGLVGESGCGKSTLGRVLMRLLNPSAGEIRFEGQDFGRAEGETLRRLRGRMQMVFQDPNGSLNPRMKVRDIVLEPLHLQGANTAAQHAALPDLLQAVGLTLDQADRYPHQFSGGQRQRIGLARALAPNPSLIICDEPVSALDVSIQAQIVNLLADLRQQRGLSYIFISHDLRVVRHLAERVAVMYLGRIVEEGPTAEIYGHPRHPYTRMLLAAVPDAGRARTAHRATPGDELPSPIDPPSGCAFHPRCPLATDLCRTQRPDLSGGTAHRAACHHA